MGQLSTGKGHWGSAVVPSSSARLSLQSHLLQPCRLLTARGYPDEGRRGSYHATPATLTKPHRWHEAASGRRRRALYLATGCWVETWQLCKLPLSRTADLLTHTCAHCRRQSRTVSLKRNPEGRDCGLAVLGHQAYGTLVSSLGLESPNGRTGGHHCIPGKLAGPWSSGE